MYKQERIDLAARELAGVSDRTIA